MRSRSGGGGLHGGNDLRWRGLARQGRPPVAGACTAGMSWDGRAFTGLGRGAVRRRVVWQGGGSGWCGWDGERENPTCELGLCREKKRKTWGYLARVGTWEFARSGQFPPVAVFS